MKEFKICTVKTLSGMEDVAAAELKKMEFKKVSTGKRAVRFESDQRGIYLANLNMRNAMSILMPVHEFKFGSNKDFIMYLEQIPWEDFFDLKCSFSIKSTVFSKEFNNSNYPALLVKDSIADRFRKKFNKRPNVDKERPDVVIDVYVSENRCTVSLNSSGNPLYMRGYRNMPFEAPLNECLAAGLIGLSGWNDGENFINPMCGSGTLVVEAAMMSMNIHPAKTRDDFAFKNWRNFDAELFENCRKELISAEIPKPKAMIQASDISSRALSITRNSLSILGLDEAVDLFKMNILKPEVKSENGVLFLNPPYDERIKTDDIMELYAGIGKSLKFQYVNHRAWLFTSNFEALKKIGLKPFKKFDLFNGQIPCKLLGYDLFKSE